MKLLTLLILSFSFATYSQSCKETAPQRAAFIEIPIEQRIQLWNDHLLNYESEHIFSLSPAQLDVIEHARVFILPTVYERQDAQDLTRWRQALRAEFSLREGAQIFERMPEYVPTQLKDGVPLNMIQRPQCNCSPTWTFCDTGSCNTECIGCTCRAILDCGPFWAFTCSGMCVFI